MSARAWPKPEEHADRELPAIGPGKKGMALLGLLGLMGFLVIVLVCIVITASWARQSGKEQLTCRTLEGMANALKVYHQATGEFPPTAETNAELLAYLQAVAQSREAVEAMPDHVFQITTSGKEILDGWGRPVSYTFDAAAKKPILVSEGPDGDDPADNLYAEGLGSEF